MISRERETLYHLCEVLEWAKGNRGSKNINPYTVPVVIQALKYIAYIQDIFDYLEAVTDKGGVK